MTLFLLAIYGFDLYAGRSDYSKIINRRIFADPPPVPEKQARSILKPEGIAALDSIISLKGIIFNPEGDSFAIVWINEKKIEALLSEGDIIENAFLKKINNFDVVFLYGGADVRMVLPKPQAGSSGIVIKDTQVKVVPPAQTEKSTVVPQEVASAVSGSSIPSPQAPRSVNLNEIAEKFRSDPSLIASVSVTPFIQNGMVEGFVVNRVPETGISAQLGIQPGDVIKRVNGTLIDSLSRAYAVYNNVINSSSKLVTVEIIRGGQSLILTYRLE